MGDLGFNLVQKGEIPSTRIIHEKQKKASSIPEKAKPIPR
jgi:hypothetical protein